MSSFDAYAIALGVPLGDHVVMKVQYTIQNIDLVRGVTDQDIRTPRTTRTSSEMEIGVHF